MDMFNLLSKISELEKTQLTESSHKDKGVTKHKGTYGTSHKAGDEPSGKDDGEKKSVDTSHLQSFLGSKPADHDSKEGRVHKLSDKPPKDSKYKDDEESPEAPKKRGRPKKSLKDWIEALDEMLAENVEQLKMVNNPDGSREIIDTSTGLSREYPKSVAGQANTDFNKLKLQAQAQQPQTATNSSQPAQQGQQGQQAVKEEELDEKWDKETKVAPSERGKYEGKTKAELLKMYNALKKSGPHKKGSKEFGKMRELQFAIRAKKEKDAWGKVDEADVVLGSQPSPFTTIKRESKMKIKEGTDPHEAARSEGRSHAMAGHPYSCRHGKGTMEAQCYHEGYVHALEECYGQQNEEMVEEESLLPPMRDIFRGKPDVQTVEPFKRPEPGTSKALGRQMPGAGLAMHGDQYDDGPVVGAVRSGVNKLRGMFKEDDLEESPFSWAAKNTPEGEKFTVGGKTFTKKADEGMYQEGWNEGADLDAIASDPMLESWDKQLNELLTEDSDQSAKKSLAEGVTVTTSTGQQGVPDNVSISASGEDAAALMALLNNSGISSTGAMPKQGHLSPMTNVRGDGEEPNMAAISIRAMPNGMGMSQQSDYEEEVDVKEPYEYDQILGALDDGGEEPCDDAATAMGTLRSKLLSLEEAKSPHEDPIHGHEKTEIMRMPLGKPMLSKQPPYEKEVDLDDGGEEPYDDAATAMGTLRSKLSSLAEAKKAKSPHEDPIHGHEKTEIMRMPLGKMLSHNVKDKVAPTPEAVDPDQVDSALAKDAKKAKPSEPTDKKKSIYKEGAELVSEEKQDASEPVVDPHKKTPIMRMPLGKGVSQEPTEDPTDIVEPTNQKEVVSALSTDAKKEIDADKEFKALKSLLDKQNMMDSPSSKKTVKEAEEVDASVDAGNLVLSMPLGKGVSQEPTEDEREAPEAFEQDQVIDALSKDAKKELQADRDFAALKKLIGAHIKVDEKGEKAETPSSKSSGPASYENAVDKVETKAPKVEEDETEDQETEKVAEGKETCHECGEMMSEEHSCEAEKLEEWANSLRDKKGAKKTSDEQFTADEEFMNDTISSGPNNKKRDQTTLPHTEVKVREAKETLNHWLKLCGLR